MTSSKPLAIITGGAGYIGQAIVEALVANDWDVAILSRTEKEIAGAQTYVCDVTNEDDVRKSIDKIMEEHESISACIHAASPALVRKQVLELTVEESKSQMDVAFLGAFLLAKYAVQHMSLGSAFIGITTMAIEPEATPKQMGTYPAAKTALRVLLRSLAKELESKQVRVYAVAPSFLPGGLNSDLPPAVLEFILKKQESSPNLPAGISELILKMLQHPAEYPSGSSIAVSSGVISDL